ncbi:methylenetetrahydrofolate reductase [Aidingimonas halophila]|uniref:Methylenetetrahydrofolate reductase (NADPH) n=1 Tax=Aidingimonas halophila TaxID=574349 RepID=A0A1H3GIS4_9GAMM|nr:methylenetetrahydrofolate reductase [Aidingimonas halophila]GHC33218.1 methylenetetrahydrofolate reductase [Aidingimonas halophila]SDY02404.1 methylenetetrahydrofolate reductase (NADPH) [Aidingimonas halophila]
MLQVDHTEATPADHGIPSVTAPVEQRIQALAQDWSLEVTPGTAPSLLNSDEQAAVKRQVYVTHLPGQPFADVIATAQRLKQSGHDPIPHLVARSIPDRETLRSGLERLTNEAGVSAVLLIAGSMATPLGPYPDTLALLDDISLSRHGIHRLAIAGHPEGHFQADEDALDLALRSKLDYAEREGLQAWVVTQFLFDAQPLIDWKAHLRQRGIDVPIRVGLPGPATLTTLWKYAMSCGIGPSMWALQRQGGRLFKLAKARPPVEQVLGLAEQHDPALSLHFYPFGGIDKTLAWGQAIESGHFQLDAQQQEIHVLT